MWKSLIVFLGTCMFLPKKVLSFPPPATLGRYSFSVHARPYAKTYYEFSRPHTLIGTGMSVVSLHRFARPHLAITKQIPSIAWSLFLCSLANIIITGTNQLHDQSIDKINKPDLVLVRGELSESQAKKYLTLTKMMLILNAMLPLSLNTLPLLNVLGGSLLLGYLYNTPPFRWKRNPWKAMFSIAMVRGVLVNVGIYLHAIQTSGTDLLRGDIVKIGSIVPFFLGLSILISLLKDAPDQEGDLVHNVRTFSLQWGTKTVIGVSNFLFQTLFVTYAIFLLVCYPFLEKTCSPAKIAASWLFLGFGFVSPFSSKQLKSSYERLWKFFFLSYAILPMFG